MTPVLILFAHPSLEKSRVHRQLIRCRPDLPGLTFHDLYEAYPTFAIDVPREQALLAAHDLVILQHPFFWYSTPPLVKQWMDLVLEHGWAYGSEGTALQDKRVLSLVTTGGAAEAYRPDGYNRYTMRELLAPIEQTVYLCGMDYLPPYVIHGTHRMTPADIDAAGQRYRRLLTWLHDDRIDFDAVRPYPTLDVALLHHAPAGEVAP